MRLAGLHAFNKQTNKPLSLIYRLSFSLVLRQCIHILWCKIVGTYVYMSNIYIVKSLVLDRCPFSENTFLGHSNTGFFVLPNLLPFLYI